MTDMRVCMATTSYPRFRGDWAGAFVADLAMHLAADEGMEITIIAPGDAGAPSRQLDGKLEIRRPSYFWPARGQKLAYGSGIPWNLRVSKTAWLNIPCFLAVFAREMSISARQADVLHAHWGVTGALAVLTRPLHGRPVVVTVHGSDLRTTIRPVRWLTRWAIQHADAVTTPSEQFHEACCQIRGSARLCYFVPNGVDLMPAEQIEALRAAETPPSPPTRIVSIGRLIPERRQDVLVRAFGRLKRRFPSATLTLVGDGVARGEIERLIARLRLSDSIRLVGQVAPTEVPRYLCAADLYVSATTIESFGLAVLEAAAYGLPLVTTNVGYTAKLVSHGQTGYVVEPDDEDALVECMAAMLSDPEKMRRAGAKTRRRVEQLGLTWRQSAARFAEAYRAAAASRGGRPGRPTKTR